MLIAPAKYPDGVWRDIGVDMYKMIDELGVWPVCCVAGQLRGLSGVTTRSEEGEAILEKSEQGE